MEWVKVLVLKWIFQDGLKQIEKLNLTTKALEQMYKVPDLKKNWIPICDGVSELLLDCADEAKKAREWTYGK